jgi:hypothetical protein
VRRVEKSIRVRRSLDRRTLDEAYFTYGQSRCSITMAKIHLAEANRLFKQTETPPPACASSIGFAWMADNAKGHRPPRHRTSEPLSEAERQASVECRENVPYKGPLSALVT